MLKSWKQCTRYKRPVKKAPTKQDLPEIQRRLLVEALITDRDVFPKGQPLRNSAMQGLYRRGFTKNTRLHVSQITPAGFEALRRHSPSVEVFEFDGRKFLLNYGKPVKQILEIDGDFYLRTITSPTLELLMGPVTEQTLNEPVTRLLIGRLDKLNVENNLAA